MAESVSTPALPGAGKLRRRWVDPLRRVIEAVEEGNVGRLKELVADPETRRMLEERSAAARVPKGQSPLVLAVLHDKLAVVRFIIQQFGSRVNLEQETSTVIEGGYPVEGATPLWTASTLGRMEFVQLLIEKGADIEHATDSQSSPLRGAAFDGHCDVCEFLLDRGARIDRPNQVGQSPLTIAAAMQKEDCVRLLIKKGANVRHRGHNGDTPLHVSVESGSVEIAKLLVQSGAKNDPNDVGFTPALLACCYGHHPVMTYLDSVFTIRPLERYNCLCLLAAKDVLGGNNVGAEKWFKEAIAVRRKHPTVFASLPPASNLYDEIVEPVTEADINFIMQEDVRMFFVSSIYCERILGRVHPTTAFYIRISGDMALADDRFDKCVELWQRSLDFDKAARMAYELQITEDLLFSVRGFARMASKGYTPPVEPHFRWGLKEFRQAHESKISENSVMCCLLRMVAVWIVVVDTIKDSTNRAQEMELVTEAVDSLIMIMRGSPCPLLVAGLSNLPENGVACKDIAEAKLPLGKAVAMLLEQGCSLNVENEDGNFPLHLAVMLNEDSSLEVVKTLLEYGAHFDAVNYSGQTALDIARQPDTGYAELRAQTINELERATWRHLTLQCIASHAVVRYKIDFMAILPRNVSEFVSWHEYEKEEGVKELKKNA